MEHPTHLGPCPRLNTLPTYTFRTAEHPNHHGPAPLWNPLLTLEGKGTDITQTNIVTYSRNRLRGLGADLLIIARDNSLEIARDNSLKIAMEDILKIARKGGKHHTHGHLLGPIC